MRPLKCGVKLLLHIETFNGSLQIKVNFINEFINFFGALLSNDNKIHALLVYICHLLTIHGVLIKQKSWICAMEVNTTKPNSLMEHCFYRFQIFEAQFGTAVCTPVSEIWDLMYDLWCMSTDLPYLLQCFLFVWTSSAYSEPICFVWVIDYLCNDIC